eukprot:TRINITY_DN216_c0_g1_i1.p1 TRINITY_DN216_c0_g1~~TRINITY_DN216_c0_g1_i1.p1  ORF type:complete len:344 (+),score=88.66 TRINITY_DN216_c0_g1_i1:312-1343(+)
MDYLLSNNQYGETGLRDTCLDYHCPLLGGSLHFVKFQTRRIENFIRILHDNKLICSRESIFATGGGAHKYEKLIASELKIASYTIHDEMKSLMKGIHFIFNTAPNECYSLASPDYETRVSYQIHASNGPYLVVNIGSGVSILRVDGEDNFTRVGGTSVGGGTFFGLCSVLTGCQSYSEGMKLAAQGNNYNVDMLVSDIYGGDYKQFNLPGTAIASSFGKMIRPESRQQASKADLARSALVTVTNNIGSIAHLHARLEKIDKVIFVGNFLTGNQISQKALSYAMDFWSKNNIKALFLQHEGYFGCVGSLISSLNEVSSPLSSPSTSSSTISPPSTSPSVPSSST